MKKTQKLFLLPIAIFSIFHLGYASDDEIKTDDARESKVEEVTEKKVEAKPEVKKTIFGHDEMVILPQMGDLELHAKLDTGAKTASLSAKDLKIFTKNKDKWVRFKLENGKKYYEFPIKRMSRIKKRSGEITSADDQTYTERPVIELEVCLGDQMKKLEVNLTDRSRFTFQFLIGKIGLSKLKAIVDPSAAKLTTPVCPTVK